MTGSRPHAPTVLAAMEAKKEEIERAIRQTVNFAGECRAMAVKADEEAAALREIRYGICQEIGRLQAFLHGVSSEQEARNFSC
jgi:hypothetical protein